MERNFFDRLTFLFNAKNATIVTNSSANSVILKLDVAPLEGAQPIPILLKICIVYQYKSTHIRSENIPQFYIDGVVKYIQCIDEFEREADCQRDIYNQTKENGYCITPNIIGDAKFLRQDFWYLLTKTRPIADKSTEFGRVIRSIGHALDMPNTLLGILVMPFMEGYLPFYKIRDDSQMSLRALACAVHLLGIGYNHNDFHEANIMANPTRNQVVIIDFGRVTKIAEYDRRILQSYHRLYTQTDVVPCAEIRGLMETRFIPDDDLQLQPSEALYQVIKNRGEEDSERVIATLRLIARLFRLESLNMQYTYGRPAWFEPMCFDIVSRFYCGKLRAKTRNESTTPIIIQSFMSMITVNEPLFSPEESQKIFLNALTVANFLSDEKGIPTDAEIASEQSEIAFRDCPVDVAACRIQGGQTKRKSRKTLRRFKKKSQKKKYRQKTHYNAKKEITKLSMYPSY